MSGVHPSPQAVAIQKPTTGLVPLNNTICRTKRVQRARQILSAQKENAAAAQTDRLSCKSSRERDKDSSLSMQSAQGIPGSASPLSEGVSAKETEGYQNACSMLTPSSGTRTDESPSVSSLSNGIHYIVFGRLLTDMTVDLSTETSSQAIPFSFAKLFSFFSILFNFFKDTIDSYIHS